MSSTNVGVIDLQLLLNTTNFNRNLKSTANTIKSSGIENSLKNIGKLALAALSVRAIVNFGKQCIKLGSDLEEVQNVVDVTFGELNTEVNKFAQNAIEQFGLGQTVAKKYVGTFGAMAKAFNFSNKEALAMSETLTGLVGDVASFYNLSSDLAYTKLKSVFTGETETLKDLGVVMTQNALDQYALANGYGKTTSKMTEQEKVALRYKFVMDKLSLANGDFARTSDSWANQTRVLSLRFNELKATLGQGFINVFTPIVKGINWVISKLQVLANAFKSFTEMIFGKAGGKNKSSAISSTSSDVSQLTNGATNAGKAVKGIGDSAKKTAKDLKSLASFDTAQILRSNKDDSYSGGSSGAGAGGGGLDVGMPLDFSNGLKEQAADIEKILNGVNLEPLKQSFNNLREAISYFGQGCGKILDGFYNNYLKPLGNYVISDALPHFLNSTANAMKAINFDKLKIVFDDLWKSLEPFTENIGNGLLWFYDNVLLPLKVWEINDVLPAFLKILKGSIDIINQAIEVCKPSFNWLWDNFLQPIASWTGGVIVTILNDLGDALTSIGAWMEKNKTVVSDIKNEVVLFFGAWKGIELMSFIAQSGGIVTALKNIMVGIQACTIAKIVDNAETAYLNVLYAKDFVLSIVSGTKALMKQAIQWGINTGLKIKDKIETLYLNALYAKDFVKSVVSGTAALVKQAAQWVANTAVKVADTVATIASTAATTAATAATWLFNTALAVLTSPITLVIAAIAGLVAGIYLLIKNWDKVKEVGANSIDKIKNAWNYAGEWFNNHVTTPIKNFFGNMCNNVKTKASNTWNGIKGVFSAVGIWFSSKFQQAYNGITRVFSNIGNFFSNIWNRIRNTFSKLGTSIGNAISNAVKSGINGVISTIERTINRAISLINGAIGLINKIPGVNVRRISSLRLPRLAQGGYVKANTPQLAMIGDNRHHGEIVAPEDKIMNLYKKANQEMGLGNNARVIELLEKIIQILINLNFDFNLYLDSYELNSQFEKIKKKNKFLTNGGY